MHSALYVCILPREIIIVGLLTKKMGSCRPCTSVASVSNQDHFLLIAIFDRKTSPFNGGYSYNTLNFIEFCVA